MITDDTDTVVVLDEEPPPVHRALGSRHRMDEIDGTPGGHLPPVEVLKPPDGPLPSASQGPPRASREAPALRNDAYWYQVWLISFCNVWPQTKYRIPLVLSMWVQSGMLHHSFLFFLILLWEKKLRNPKQGPRDSNGKRGPRDAGHMIRVTGLGPVLFTLRIIPLGLYHNGGLWELHKKHAGQSGGHRGHVWSQF